MISSGKKLRICTWFILTILNLVYTAPTTSQEPEQTSESPDLTPRTESPTQSPSKLQFDTISLLRAEILSFTLTLYSENHFDELLKAHALGSEYDDIRGMVLGKSSPRYKLPENILQQAGSCTAEKATIESIITLSEENIKLYDAISVSKYKPSNTSIIRSLKSLQIILSQMLTSQGQQPTSQSQTTSVEATSLSKTFSEVLRTAAILNEEMATCVKVFDSLRKNCI